MTLLGVPLFLSFRCPCPGEKLLSWLSSHWPNASGELRIPGSVGAPSRARLVVAICAPGSCVVESNLVLQLRPLQPWTIGRRSCVVQGPAGARRHLGRALAGLCRIRHFRAYLIQRSGVRSSRKRQRVLACQARAGLVFSNRASFDHLCALEQSVRASLRARPSPDFPPRIGHPSTIALATTAERPSAAISVVTIVVIVISKEATGTWHMACLKRGEAMRTPQIAWTFSPLRIGLPPPPQSNFVTTRIWN